MLQDGTRSALHPRNRLLFKKGVKIYTVVGRGYFLLLQGQHAKTLTLQMTTLWSPLMVYTVKESLEVISGTPNTDCHVASVYFAL